MGTESNSESDRTLALDPGATNTEPLPSDLLAPLFTVQCEICAASYSTQMLREENLCPACYAARRILQEDAGVEIRSDEERLLFTASLSDYEQLSPIGEGSTAVVFSARRREDGQPVAIKILHPALVADPPSRRRFGRQARVLRLLHHPNLLMLLDQGDASSEQLKPLLPLLPTSSRRLWENSQCGTFFLVTEYCAHGSLAQLVQSRYPKGIPVELGLRLLRAALSGLACMHRLDLHHRDIKPNNLLLVGDDQQLKIADFGLVTSELMADFKSLTTTSSGLGTLAFLVFPQTHTITDDVWGLAATFFYALTGLFPRDEHPEWSPGDNYRRAPLRRLEQVRPDLPKKLCDVLYLALQSKEHRFPSALEMQEALRQAELI